MDYWISIRPLLIANFTPSGRRRYAAILHHLKKCGLGRDRTYDLPVNSRLLCL